MVTGLLDPLLLLHWKYRGAQRKYAEFGVYDVHSGELVAGPFDSKSEAGAHKKEHSHRVRGVCK